MTHATQPSVTSTAHGDDRAAARSLASPFPRAERRLEGLDAARDNAPMCAAISNRDALEAAFERELKS